MKLSFFSFLNILLDGKASKRLLIGVIGSFSFSIAVILCTIGLMDGFESTLVKSLQRSNGDLILKKKSGFFLFDQKVKNLVNVPSVENLTPTIQIEAFAISNKKAKGVIVKGIDSKSFSGVTDLEVGELGVEVAIGAELARLYNLSVGDLLTLTFASNQKRNQGSPIVQEFSVGAIVEHGVYEKDLRFVYIDRHELLELLNYRADTINSVIMKTIPYDNLEMLVAYKDQVRSKVGSNFSVYTFWNEFKVLLNAVEVEKFSISLILQLIVIVAIFNVIAFIIFVSEKKSQEFFLLRVLGINLKSVVRFWMLMLVFLWGISCIVSIFMTKFFNFLIGSLDFFKLPGDVYVLSRLRIELGVNDYLIVFGLALLWILLIGFIGIYNLRKKTLLQGLRQEFS
jgi:ABC-type lipoprotein release transport system permease subunit